jgi:hypothetical protein
MAQINKPNEYFNTVLYTGDGSSPRSLTGVNFQPDWVWLKRRNDADQDIEYLMLLEVEQKNLLPMEQKQKIHSTIINKF